VGNGILELDPKFYLNKRLKPKKAIISDSLSAFAPVNIVLSNRFKNDLEKLYFLHQSIANSQNNF
jgi:hypothetical protein